MLMLKLKVKLKVHFKEIDKFLSSHVAHVFDAQMSTTNDHQTICKLYSYKWAALKVQLNTRSSRDRQHSALWDIFSPHDRFPKVGVFGIALIGVIFWNIKKAGTKVW